MRKLAAVVSLSVLVGALAFAGLATAKVKRRVITINTVTMTEYVAPHVLNSPFQYVVSGAVVPPTYLCAPGVMNLNYCMFTEKGTVCFGTVTVTVSLGNDPDLADSGEKVQTVKTALRPDCTYSAIRTIPNSVLTATSHLSSRDPGLTVDVFFKAHFHANAGPVSVSAPTVTRVAHVINPN